ncbi:MAG: hypothetical protein U0237_07725 [Thermoleophilia bacterium]
MRYMLLIYADESQRNVDPTPEEMAASMQPWFEYGEKWASVIRGGEPLTGWRPPPASPFGTGR